MLRYRDLNSEIPISISSFAHVEIGHRSRAMGQTLGRGNAGSKSVLLTLVCPPPISSPRRFAHSFLDKVGTIHLASEICIQKCSIYVW